MIDSYKMRGEAVVIHKPFGEDVVLNRASAEKAAANVKRNRDTYATEAAYLAHLASYENALAYLDANAPQETD